VIKMGRSRYIEPERFLKLTPMLSQTIIVVGDRAQSLAIVRALSTSGYRVVLTHTQPFSATSFSKYCAENWQSPALDSPEFEISFLEFLQAQPNLAGVFPVGISDSLVVQEICRKHQLDVPIAGVRSELIRIFHDKVAANELAQSAGVRVPKSLQVSDLTGIKKAVGEIGFPIIIKSGSNAGDVRGRKAYIVPSAQLLESVFAQWPQGHTELMIQSYHPGDIVSADFVAKAGEIVSFFEGDTDETDMPDGTGFAVNFHAGPPSEQLLFCLESIVRACNYSGPGLIQCIRDPEDSELTFIELNPRLSAGVSEVVNAGLNIPKHTFEVAQGKSLKPIEDAQDIRYRVGSCTYWLERDFLGYKRRCNWWSVPSHLQWLSQALVRLWRCDAHVNWRWSDPVPSFMIMFRSLTSWRISND